MKLSETQEKIMAMFREHCWCPMPLLARAIDPDRPDLVADSATEWHINCIRKQLPNAHVIIHQKSSRGEKGYVYGRLVRVEE